MKRIQSACICQTLRFQAKEDLGSAYAVESVRQEVAHYKKSLERNRTPHKIVEELPQADGSIILKIIKQYNTSPVGNYLD